ncbi:transporter substrate-binding domain-containing protein [Reyranella sp.]|uniref:transporter substrate-binding domain-containing protein n=1 Tax=Reyranella sp. TaxID=1929291 RepID=UPI003D0F73CA
MRLVVLFLAMLALATGALAQQQPPPAKPAPRPAAQPAKPAPAKPPAPKSPFTPPAFKITIATEGAYPPFNYLDRKGLPAGFEMELAQDACQRMKAECEFVAAKWDDLVPGLIDKKFDIVMSSLEVNNERRRRLGMSRRYYLSPGAFIAAKGQPFDGPPSLLRNRKIGVQKDSTHLDWLDKSFRRSAQIKRYPTVADALNALTSDEVDAVFGDKVQLWLWSQKPEGKCCEVMGQDIKDTQTLGVGVSAGIRREDIKLRDAFNKALGEMMSDGTYKKISEKYFPFPLN